MLESEDDEPNSSRTKVSRDFFVMINFVILIGRESIFNVYNNLLKHKCDLAFNIQNRLCETFFGKTEIVQAQIMNIRTTRAMDCTIE